MYCCESGKAKITKAMIEDAEPESIIVRGETIDNEDGLNMSRSGQKLRYIIFRGGIADWCIYAHTADKSWEWIRKHGDKPHTKEFIANVVEFDDEVWKMYRH